MRRLMAIGLLSCFACLFCIAVSAAAAPADDPYSISFGGVWAFRITQPAGGLTAKQRVTEITKRVVQVFNKYRTGQDLPMTIASLGSNAEIYIGGMPLVTVTPVDAEGSGLTPLKLAVQWAKKLYEGLNRALPADQPYI